MTSTVERLGKENAALQRQLSVVQALSGVDEFTRTVLLEKVASIANGATTAEIKEFIEERGGLTSDSVSKKTDVVLVGEAPGSKRDKAIELNIPIWNQEKLYEIIGDTGNKE